MEDLERKKLVRLLPEEYRDGFLDAVVLHQDGPFVHVRFYFRSKRHDLGIFGDVRFVDGYTGEESAFEFSGVAGGLVH